MESCQVGFEAQSAPGGGVYRRMRSSNGDARDISALEMIQRLYEDDTEYGSPLPQDRTGGLRFRRRMYWHCADFTTWDIADAFGLDIRTVKGIAEENPP